ncbi:MAG TPA: winged helix-turn-helix domain-containing protein [Nitrososphaera sp.]|nr:winged helix-turn-helix domain-containing protein [Nitrososphaera sp.]
MARHRTRTEIVADILSLARENDIPKTHIQYRAGLSFEQVQEYLSFLVANELMEARPEGGTKYRTTEKG